MESLEQSSSVIPGQRWLTAAVALLMLTALRPQAEAQTNFKVVYSFKGSNASDGSSPSGTLIRDGVGNLYGTAGSGGTTNAGTVFKLSARGRETQLYSFIGGGADGVGPRGALVLDAAGNIYGATYSGGTPNAGTLFKVDPTGTETLVYSFTGGTDGAYPYGGVVRDAAGNLYGTTAGGGVSTNCSGGCGTVFKVDPSGKETVLYSFTGTPDGYNVQAGLVRDTAGNLYGTTVNGGTSTNCSGGCGLVFKVSSSGHETVLYGFTGNPDGGVPIASLVRDATGNLYGTTYYGGTNNVGTVFKVDAGGKESVRYSFNGGTDGEYPQAGLLLDPAGNLYGTTYYGGSGGYGTVFEVDASGAETILHSFDGRNNGRYPSNGLTRDAGGNLYGTAGGGIYGQGIAFKLTF